jgi:hypothetical protein
MKKDRAKMNDNDELRAEYDFSKLKGGERGKYYKRYFAGTDLVHYTLVPVPKQLVREVRQFIDSHQKRRVPRKAARPRQSK